jgi:serine/threonine protein kinase
MPGQTGSYDRRALARRIRNASGAVTSMERPQDAAAPRGPIRDAEAADIARFIAEQPTLPPLPVPPPARQGWTSGTQFSHYEIESRLATGGMAEVWLAKIKGVEGFEKRIVIKTMLLQLQHRPELMRMFIREASLAAQLCHPHIVQAFDFGQLDGRYFIAMEYLPGLTLRQVKKRLAARGRRLPITVALHVMVDICEALHHIHELGDGQGPLGLVHRDLSPDNVIISAGGTAKLIDFGAARATARLPPSPVFVGKYRYAAPERIRHLREDRRSDVFSAGVVLYECLTGARPFEGTDLDVIAAIASGTERDPRQCVPEIPESIAQITLRAMAADPAERHASARDLATDLLGALAELRAANKEREVSACVAALLRPDEAAPTSALLVEAPPPPEAAGTGEADSDGGDLYEIEIFEPTC